MTITLFLHNRRPSFAPHPAADRAEIAVPEGSELLTAFGLVALYVPTDRLVRTAWTAAAVWQAAESGTRGFGVTTPPRSPRQVARLAADAERLATKRRQVARLRATGLTQAAVARRTGYCETTVAVLDRMNRATA